MKPTIIYQGEKCKVLKIDLENKYLEILWEKAIWVVTFRELKLKNITLIQGLSEAN